MIIKVIFAAVLVVLQPVMPCEVRGARVAAAWQSSMKALEASLVAISAAPEVQGL